MTYLEPTDISAWSNRFALPALSPFTQAMIRAYDDKLVVFASAEEPLYRVARKEGCPGWVALLSGQKPDYQVCMAHGLNPVTSVFPANISAGDPWPRAISEISERDMFRIASERRAGGAIDNCGNLYTDHQEEREAAREVSWRRGVNGEIDARAYDAYGLHARRAGMRVYQNDPASRERAKASNIRLDFRGGSSIRVPEIRQPIVLTDA